MKTPRLLIVVLNFVLIGILAFAGVKFYTKFDGTDYFKELTWETINKWERRQVKDPRGLSSRLEYEQALEPLARPPKIEKPPPEIKKPDEVARLYVEVTAVSFSKDSPETAGAHLVAKGVSRYLQVGDGQPIASDMPYRLKEIKEEKPGKEWILLFEDDKGKLSQTKYVKK